MFGRKKKKKIVEAEVEDEALVYEEYCGRCGITLEKGVKHVVRVSYYVDEEDIQKPFQSAGYCVPCHVRQAQICNKETYEMSGVLNDKDGVPLCRGCYLPKRNCMCTLESLR